MYYKSVRVIEVEIIRTLVSQGPKELAYYIEVTSV